MNAEQKARCDKYLKLVNWARDRYTRNGALKLTTGGKPHAWLRIENAAYERYLGETT